MTKVVHPKVHVIFCTKSHASKSEDVKREREEAIMITQQGRTCCSMDGGRRRPDLPQQQQQERFYKAKNVQLVKQYKAAVLQKWNTKKRILGRKNRKLHFEMKIVQFWLKFYCTPNL